MSDEVPQLELLTDASEHWYRQAQPDAVVDRGQVNFLAFRLTPRDAGKLSGARCRKQTAQGAYDEHVARGRRSKGTWALTVGEIADTGAAHGITLACYDDSAVPADPPPSTGHTYIDATAVDKAVYDLVRVAFAKRANDRGCVYAPPE